MSDKRLEEYRNGAEGMISWCEENVKVNHEYIGKSNKTKKIWESQKVDFRKALIMDNNNRFINSIIAFIERRSSGKSFQSVLIQLWKFFCFENQIIIFADNSRRQLISSHLLIALDIIRSSPKLKELITMPSKNEIKLKGTSSCIRRLSPRSGIYSNITGFTFSNMCELEDEGFFMQLVGSTKNIYNTLGVIESIKPRKSHILHRLYESSLTNEVRGLFVKYDESLGAY